MPSIFFLWQVSFGLGKGLVPLGNKSIPMAMFIEFCVAIWHHNDTMSTEMYISVDCGAPTKVQANQWVDEMN